MRTTFQAVTAIVMGLALGGSAGVAVAQGVLERLEERQFGQAKPPLVVDPNRAKEPPKKEAEKPAERGYLGVVSDDTDDKGRGVRVVEIVKGSPAEEAGLKVGDLITAIDGKPVRQTSDVPDATKGAGPGTKLGITVVRDAATRTFTVTLGRRPDDAKLPPPPPERDPGQPLPPEPGKVPAIEAPAQPKPPPPVAGGAEPPRLGVVMRSYADDPRFVLGRQPLRGVQVLEVLANSPASQAGLRAGDIIVAVSGLAVGDTQELRDSLASRRMGEEVDMTFYRGRTLYRQKIRLGAGEVGGPIEAPPVARLSDSQRIEALERRVQELERRLADLDKKPEPPAPKKE